MCFHTFGVRHPIDDIDSENQPESQAGFLDIGPENSFNRILNIFHRSGPRAPAGPKIGSATLLNSMNMLLQGMEYSTTQDLGTSIFQVFNKKSKLNFLTITFLRKTKKHHTFYS